MRAGQREAVHVLIDLLHRNFPSPDRMTGLAIRAHLALVDIGVAVGALVANVSEDHLGMAGRAGHTFVQAAQGILGLIVIELRHRSNGFPPINGVAVLARDIQISVRTARALCRLWRAGARRGKKQHQRDG